MKYATGDILIVNEYLRNYFGSITVNTPFNIENMIFISKKESRLGFDLELVVQDSDLIHGYIKPGYTSIDFKVEKEVTS